MTEPNPEAWIERIKFIGETSFGGKFRPQFSYMVASGAKTWDDVARINAFVDALDVAKTTRMNRMANVVAEHAGQEQDYLNALGAGAEIVRHVNRDDQAADEPDSGYWTALANRVARYMGESGELIFPNDNPFAGAHARVDIPDVMTPGDQVMWALEQIARVPGFVYRSIDEVGQVQRGQIDTQQIDAMVDQGYDPGDIWDRIAFNWTNGESDFRDLGPAREAYGDDMVDAAVEIFRAGGIDPYMRELEAKVRAGTLSPEQYAEFIQITDEPGFADAYDAVNRRHVSFGRDLARLILPDEAEDSGWFTAVSGIGDTALALTVDPLLVGSKVGRAAYMAKYGVTSLTDSKVYRLYGVRNPRTGETFEKAADPVARANVEDFLARAASIRFLRAEGDEIAEAAELAALERIHPQLMPLFNEVNGQRFALTAAEREAAEKAGTYATHIGGGEPFLVINTDPITTIDDFADYLVNTGALARVLAGRSSREGRLIPGRTGWWAERQFFRNRRVRRAEKKGRQTAERLAEGPDLPGTIAPGSSSVVNAGSTLDDLLRAAENGELDADKVIAWDWSEQMKQAFIERGKGFREIAEGRLGRAKEMKARWEATQRRFSTLLPEEHVIAFNSLTAGREIERFAATFLPKHEAVRLRAVWERGTEATRRAVGKAIVLEVAEAAGLTHSTIGRRFIQKWMDDLDNVNNRRYGLADTDRIPDVHGGIRRVALNMSQMENFLVLPSFTEMKRAAAKAAVLGMDIPVTDNYIQALAQQFPDASQAQLREAAEQMAQSPGTWREALADDPLGLGFRLLTFPTRSMRYMLFNSLPAERILGILKLGYILTISNFERNMFEEYAAINASGRGGDLRYGKELLRANGETTRLIRAVHHLIPKRDRATITNPQDVELAVTRGRFLGLQGERELSEGERVALEELAERSTRPELERVMGARDDTMPEGGVTEALEMHRAGVLSEKVRLRTPKGMELKGYEEVDLDRSGLESLAAMYSKAFTDEREPARRVLAYLMWHEAAENPKFLAGLDEPTLRLMQQLAPVDNDSFLTALGKVTGLPAAHARKGRADVIYPPGVKAIEDYVALSDETAHFRQVAEYLRTDERGYPIRQGDTVAEQAAAARYVRAQIRNIAAMTSTRDGTTMHPRLVSDLLSGRTPSASDLREYAKGIDHLPKHVIAAQYLPAAPKNVGNRLITGLTGGMAKGYDFFITRPLQRFIRKPMFVGSYARHRQETMNFELMLIGRHGWEPEHAKQVAADLAYGQALHDVVRFIDNPNQSSQFSVLARNWWLFERAQEDALRRWWRVIKERPETLEYAQLAVNAGVNTGIVDLDPEGNMILTYPFSGAMMEGAMHVANILGIDDSPKVPHVDDLTTQVSYLNPSILNPIGFSGSPLVSVPFSILGAMIPGDEMFKANVELAMEGELGAGRGWWETFMPTALRRFMELGFDHDDLGSTVGGAAATALLNATVLGQLPDTGNPEAMQDFVANTQTQTWNMLVGRALFAFMAPAAPSLPEMYGQGEADWAWRESGIQGLHDEFRAMVAALGRDKALVAWQELHPEAMIYDIGRTETGAPGSQFGVALQSAQWVFDNRQLFDNPEYRQVAAYFVPDHPGEFNPTAWNALLQMSVRQYKDISTYYQQIVERGAVSEWFSVRDREEAALAEARANGDPLQPIEDAFRAEKEAVRARYPILGSFFGNSQMRGERRRQQARALEQMVNDPDITREMIPDIDGVVDMLQLYRTYEAAQEELRNQRSTQATVTRQTLERQYETAMLDIIARYPSLNDLYQGVFRYLQD